MSSTITPAGGSSRQNAAPNRSHKSPERPRGGKSRRTLIESACTACQRRKSRCDGQRPSCSRCQVLHTDCGYNAEEGESRWSALRRRNRTLERERDEARDFISQIQSRPEPEAQAILYRLRTASNPNNPGAIIHDAVSVMLNGHSQHSSLPQQYGGSEQQTHLYYHQQPERHNDLVYQHQQSQQLAQRQQPVSLPDQGGFVQPSPATMASSSTQLPPLRSMVEVPTGSANAAPSPPFFPPTVQRNMSQVSAMSSGSYTSASSEGRGGQSLSPREDTNLRWGSGPQR